jgi:heterodisulfide reductase subunit D
MLEEYRYGIYKCGRCGQCVVGEYGYVCPVQQYTGGFEHYVARGRITIAKALLEGTLTYSPPLVDAIYSCLLCGSCREQCSLVDPVTGEKLVDTIEITKAMRQDIVNAGLGPPPSMKEMDSNIERYHFFYGEVADRAKLTEWSKELGLPTKCERGDLLYFGGCNVAYFSETAKATVGILKQAGIDVAYLGEDEWCCGDPALHSGNIAVAEEVMRHNAAAIEQAGAKRVLDATMH